MTRISETELTQLKQSISLQRLVEAKGIKLTKRGADLIGRCPFHSDKTPSLIISPSKQLWHCLGACQAGGSVVDWVMKAEGVSVSRAIELLRKDHFSLAAKTSGVVDPPATREPTPAAFGGAVDAVNAIDAATVVNAVADQELLRQVVDYYHACLKETPEAMDYLAKRGLNNAEMIDHFSLGFANRTLGSRLPQNSREATANQRARLQKIGVLRDTGHEHFCGSVVIPILGEDGEVLGIYGRKIRDNLRTETVYHLYLPGPHRGVWNIAALEASDEVILCEALIDALTFWCAGYRNVTTSYGVEGFSKDHLVAFKRYGTKRVMIAYDRDDAGERAAIKLGRKLMAEGIDCWRIQFPRGMDANAYALSVQPGQRSLGVAIQSAVWLGEGKAPVVELGTMALAIPAPSASTPPAPLPSSSPPASSPPSLSPAVSVSSPSSSPSSPPVSTLDVEVRQGSDELVVPMGDRRWRVRGLAKNMSYEQMKVNLWCSRGDAFYLDTLDLYAARPRMMFLRQASVELGLDEEILHKDLGRLLLKLEELQDQQIQAKLAPKTAVPEMTEAEREAALALLRDPKLCERILADFERCGAVGEETNKLVGYIAAVSRKLEKPLAVIIQSSSAAGKSSLMDAVLAFVPDEDKVKYSAMTGQSLFYMGETSLKHKVLAIAEQTGTERTSYALKLLLSEGELTMASTGKDPVSGRHTTHEYRTEGPITVFSTTTAADIDEEFLNRCLILTVNEEREQTHAILEQQRLMQTYEGLVVRRQRPKLIRLHQNAQRLLRPLHVLNPYAHKLTFIHEWTRTRRDHQKYLGLINAITFLHQYQRPIVTKVIDGETLDCIEATQADITLANRLAHEVLGHSLDELPPQTRRLLMLTDKMVGDACKRLEMSRSDYRFSRREIREHTGWGHTQLKLHLHRLEELEYLLVHRGGRGQSIVYELLYNGEGTDGATFLVGLIDPLTLPATPPPVKTATQADEAPEVRCKPVGGKR
jgi:hypothetical protein